MSQKTVVLENSALLTGFGMTSATVAKLMAGATALASFGAPGPGQFQSRFCDQPSYDICQSARTLYQSLDISPCESEKTAFIYCTAKGAIAEYDRAIHRVPPQQSERSLHDCSLGAQCRAIVDAMGISPGRMMIVSTACASGSMALESASRLLNREICSSVLLFGYEMVTDFVLSGFRALGALSRDRARPFDAQRDGLCLGECACMTRCSFREPRHGDLVIAGCGSSNDANHRTAPSRDGAGLYRAAAAACREASLPPDSLGSVKCHGTATVYNDAMETKALQQLFKTHIPPAVSLKGALGHCSGAGSLMETILAAEFLKLRRLPPTAGFCQQGEDEPVVVRTTSQPMRAPSILSLSAGFGGINSAVIVREF